MAGILTVTLNPTVDLDSATETVRPGTKLRCSAPVMEPGGGGLNASRVIAELGGESRALVAIGGAMGQLLKGLLIRADLDTILLDGPGETRQSLSVMDRATGAQYRFLFPGPEWSASDLTRAELLIAEALPVRGFLVFSGSLPPGAPEDFPLRLVGLAAGGAAKLIIDTSGAALRVLATGAASPLAVLRMDHEEAQALAGRRLPSVSDSADAAAAMVAKGVATVVIMARGAEGSVLVSRDRRLFCKAANVPVRSKTGAGDSFVGAFTLALARRQDLGEALQRGVAAASAAVMTEGTQMCTRADAERLMAECPVTKI